MLQLRQEYIAASLEVPASMSHWDKVMDFIADQAEVILSDQSTIYKLRLACEEVFSNIMRETSDEQQEGREVSLWVSLFVMTESNPPMMVVRIEDNGPPFDPELGEDKNVNMEQPLSERKLGGLGLFLVQQSAYAAEYYYQGDRNTYCLSFKL
jgi:anti-sigma regulatory factor (Ser/Thr protein kinase)